MIRMYQNDTKDVSLRGRLFDRLYHRRIEGNSAVFRLYSIGFSMLLLMPALSLGEAPVARHAAHGGYSFVDRAEDSPLSGIGGDLHGLLFTTKPDRLYWTDFSPGTIAWQDLTDSPVTKWFIPSLRNPIGIAFDPEEQKIYWSTDGDFPRSIRRSKIDGSDHEILIEGDELNRPTALTLDLESRRIYWAESVRGKIRRARLDGSSVEDILVAKALTSFGLAIDDEAGTLYWSDFASGTIERMDLDGNNRELLLSAANGVDAPTGLALDVAAQKIYWADSGAQTINRASLDRWQIETLLSSENVGVIEPQALALDLKSRQIYWSDAALRTIQRAKLDGSQAEVLLRLSGSSQPLSKRDKSTCGSALLAAAERYQRQLFKSLNTCLKKLSWVRAVKWKNGDEKLAAQTCFAEFRRLAGQRDSESTVSGRFRAAVTKSCGKLSLQERVAAGKDLRVDASSCPKSIENWGTCVETQIQRKVWNAVANRYPRGAEWLEAVRPFIQTLSLDSISKNEISEALQALDAFYYWLNPPPDDHRKTPVNSRWRLGSGQRTSYPANRKDGRTIAVRVRDDGAVRSGGAPVYVDNEDGTVSDLNTGLMWEKKCYRCSGLHDYGKYYLWSGDGDQETIWDWIDSVNTEGGSGFAGYHDWRLPSVKELISIVNYERFNPAVSIVFNGAGCGVGCTDVTDPRCTCTAMNYYWTSTTFADFPSNAYAIHFNLGLVGDQPKEHHFFVRAVRDLLPSETSPDSSTEAK